MYNLIFFAALLGSCQTKHDAVHIVWQGTKAIGLEISDPQVYGVPDSLIEIRLHGSSIAIVGSIRHTGTNTILFEPFAPLTRSLQYEIFVKHRVLAEVTVPEPNPAAAPRIVTVSPFQDTVPLNLLKVHLAFTKPMAEGRSSSWVTLLDEKKDTVRNVLLDLQPELWNEEGNVLTLWLDPGRIKRDLVPNKNLGNPLVRGRRYTFSVSSAWTDREGGRLITGFTKEIVVAARDSVSPALAHWKIKLPVAGQTGPVRIVFEEPLDYLLLQVCFLLRDEKSAAVAGIWTPAKDQRSISFQPDQSWTPGEYTTEVDPRLEDLAGNNLRRLFEIDLKQIPGPNPEVAFKLMFEVK